MIRSSTLPAALAVAIFATSTPARAEEFCGSEETVVDDAYYIAEAGDLETAREVLVDALKHGRVHDWDRGRALSVLADVQLRMGDHRPAVSNFRRALEVDPAYADSPVRVGLAVALSHMGQADEALAEARAFAGASCRSEWYEAECFAAHELVSRLTDDPTEMFEAMRAADALRSAIGEEETARIRALLGDEAHALEVASADEPNAG